ncbi:hypothetical protein CORC01_10926 [Colletotrichum orchidophilum]|uniref:Uncharacterized protein n=1 Tax=Colletotrichum orchidophilum TaxID=1209926 RepID=A0A1G4AXB3_9PEZI|nr:uncharacterized protein CORC01_10926 [Colletotrichum orchidophilum]OHE93800.1 hypothetical protein CORC01_10926 [Colletotrichum orchidophilum]
MHQRCSCMRLDAGWNRGYVCFFPFVYLCCLSILLKANRWLGFSSHSVPYRNCRPPRNESSRPASSGRSIASSLQV